MRRFIDAVLAGRNDLAGVGVLVAVFAAVGVLRYALRSAEAGLAESVAWRSTNRLREDVLWHALRLPLGFHHETTPGEMVERVEGDIALLSNLLSRFVVTIVAEALVVLGVVAAMFVVEWRVGLVFSVSLVVGVFSVRWVAGVGRGAYQRNRAAVGSFMGFLEERLAASEDLQALDATEHALVELRRRHRQVLREDVRSALIGSSLVWASASVFTALVTVLALTVGGLQFGVGAMTLGTVFLIFAFTQQLQEPLISLSNQLQDYQRAMAGLTRTRELLQLTPETDLGDGALHRDDQRIVLEGVGFGYAATRPVLRELSLTIPAGTRVGVVGRTGSGKSTLAKLLTGLERPDSGRILFGDRDITTVTRASLRDHVALVTQDVFLLDGTVRDNISLFDPAISDERIWNALTRLGLADWVRGFEAGMDTVVSQKSVSAGQAQLLALTRVLLRDPRVLVLDEASARLDPDTESRLDRALAPVTAGRTSVIIAHRLSTLDHVDLIMVVADGQVVEYGPRESLAGQENGHFAELLRQTT